MRLDPQFAKYMVFAISLAVFAAGLAREAFMLNVGAHTLLQDLRQFDLDAENSVPAWWGSSMMLLTSLLLYVLSARAWRADDRLWRFWIVLAVVFVALSIDEAASFHEGVIEPLRAAFGFSGILLYAWVVPAFLVLVGFGVAVLPLMKDLPRSLLVRFVLFGGIFVAGALGMEMVGGWLDSQGWRMSPYYVLSVSVEEGLELLGLNLFIAVLLDQFDPGRAAISDAIRRPARRGISARSPAAQPVSNSAGGFGTYPVAAE